MKTEHRKSAHLSYSFDGGMATVKSNESENTGMKAFYPGSSDV